MAQFTGPKSFRGFRDTGPWFLTSVQQTSNRLVGVQGGWLDFLCCVVSKTFCCRSASLHPDVFKGIPANCQRRLTKIVQVGRLIAAIIRWNRIYLTNKEVSTVLCSVEKHTGSGRARQNSRGKHKT